MTHRQTPASRARHARRPPARASRLGGLVLAAAAVALLGGCCGCGLPTQASQGSSGRQRHRHAHPAGRRHRAHP